MRVSCHPFLCAREGGRQRGRDWQPGKRKHCSLSVDCAQNCTSCMKAGKGMCESDKCSRGTKYDPATQTCLGE